MANSSDKLNFWDTLFMFQNFSECLLTYILSGAERQDPSTPLPDNLEYIVDNADKDIDLPLHVKYEPVGNTGLSPLYDNFPPVSPWGQDLNLTGFNTEFQDMPARTVFGNASLDLPLGSINIKAHSETTLDFDTLQANDQGVKKWYPAKYAHRTNHIQEDKVWTGENFPTLTRTVDSLALEPHITYNKIGTFPFELPTYIPYARTYQTDPTQQKEMTELAAGLAKWFNFKTGKVFKIKLAAYNLVDKVELTDEQKPVRTLPDKGTDSRQTLTDNLNNGVWFVGDFLMFDSEDFTDIDHNFDDAPDAVERPSNRGYVITGFTETFSSYETLQSQYDNFAVKIYNRDPVNQDGIGTWYDGPGGAQYAGNPNPQYIQKLVYKDARPTFYFYPDADDNEEFGQELGDRWIPNPDWNGENAVEPKEDKALFIIRPSAIAPQNFWPQTFEQRMAKGAIATASAAKGVRPYNMNNAYLMHTHRHFAEKGILPYSMITRSRQVPFENVITVPLSKSILFSKAIDLRDHSVVSRKPAVYTEVTRQYEDFDDTCAMLIQDNTCDAPTPNYGELPWDDKEWVGYTGGIRPYDDGPRVNTVFFDIPEDEFPCAGDLPPLEEGEEYPWVGQEFLTITSFLGLLRDYKIVFPDAGDDPYPHLSHNYRLMITVNNYGNKFFYKDDDLDAAVPETDSFRYDSDQETRALARAYEAGITFPFIEAQYGSELQIFDNLAPGSTFELSKKFPGWFNLQLPLQTYLQLPGWKREEFGEFNNLAAVELEEELNPDTRVLGQYPDELRVTLSIFKVYTGFAHN